MIRLEISEEVAADLRATLEAIGLGSPLDVLMGPWVCELHGKLPARGVGEVSARAEELRQAALDWPAKRMPKIEKD